uniref:Putative shugoshin-1-like n=1 Tax=Davidia involucrata TaxID=16924 RepID=A0A5B6ZXP1_DAVIN
MDSSQADGGNRKQKSKGLGPSAIKQVQTKEKAENKRFCLRRSARFKPEEAAPTGDLFEIDSALCSSVEKEDEEGNTARDDAQELQRLSIGRPSQEKANTTTCEKIESEVGTSKCEKESSQADGGNNRPCNDNRKQKSKSLGPSAIKQVQANVKAENKRLCLRRSARFKPEEAALAGDLLEVDNAKFPVRSQHDDQMQDDGSTSTCSSVKKEDKEGNTARGDDAQELQRLSIGRPSRLAAKKVQSYKEVPLNVKMRRTD